MAKKDFIVNISKMTKAVSQQGFGLPLILGTTEAKEYTLYDDISGIAEDFGVDSKEYKIASRIFGQSPAPAQVAVHSIALEEGELANSGADIAKALLEAVNKLIEVNNDWYFLLCTENQDEVIKALAGWTDTQLKTYWATTQSLEIAGAMENENTVVMFHDNAEAYVAEGLAAIAATNAPGSLTFKFKTVKGVTEAKITSTELDALHTIGAFSYIKKMGVLQSTEGTTTSGEYIDIVMSEHFIKSRMEEEAAYLAVNTKKIPYDARGIAQLVSVVDKVIKQAGNQGIVRIDDNGNLVYNIDAANREDVSKNDVAKRVYNGISWTVELAGAIHTGTISGILTY